MESGGETGVEPPPPPPPLDIAIQLILISALNQYAAAAAAAGTCQHSAQRSEVPWQNIDISTKYLLAIYN